MNNKIKVRAVVIAILITFIISYFITVRISLMPVGRSIQDGKERLSVSVENKNIYQITISKAGTDKTRIDPENLALAEINRESGLIEIIFLKNGSGMLFVESGRHSGNIAIAGTSTVSSELNNKKPKSKLRVLYDRFSHVEKVFLRDGMILYGVIFEKGDRINFITPDGTLKLTKDDIIRVVYLKPENL